MAKRERRVKMSKEEIEAQRIAAHIEQTVETIQEHAGEVQLNEDPAPVLRALSEMDTAVAELAADMKEAADESTEEPKANSVVKAKFKQRYIENARANEVGRKAAKRSNWDWLSQRIAENCLGEHDKIDIERFKDLLEANGVDYSRWTNKNKGWEGRFRMTGRVALQKLVAERGELKGLDGFHVPPAEWIAKYKKV